MVSIALAGCAGGVLVSAYVRDSSDANRLADAHWSLSRWRQQLAERLETLVGNAPRAGLVKALLIGDRRAVDESERQVMQRTGTAHLLAISGPTSALRRLLALFSRAHSGGLPGARQSELPHPASQRPLRL